MSHPSNPLTTPRLVPDEPLPPYAHVPGRTPHPVSDPAGHSHAAPPRQFVAPDPQRWAQSRAFLYGIDLFNHGYPWEAHEVWEGLWQACGRVGVTADFLKGLIHLAAAGVKARAGVPEGVRSHGRRARELFERVAGQLRPGQERYFGLDLAELMGGAGSLADRPEEGLAFVLRPAP